MNRSNLFLRGGTAVLPRAAAGGRGGTGRGRRRSGGGLASLLADAVHRAARGSLPSPACMLARTSHPGARLAGRPAENFRPHEGVGSHFQQGPDVHAARVARTAPSQERLAPRPRPRTYAGSRTSTGPGFNPGRPGTLNRGPRLYVARATPPARVEKALKPAGLT